jgi:hypothetical protein
VKLTISHMSERAAGEAWASYGVSARGERHTAGWHVENVRSACGVEHVGPIEETRDLCNNR